MVVDLAVDRGSRAEGGVVVQRLRGCFRTSGGAKEAFGVVCAGSTIAVDDGDGPYERQRVVDKVQWTNHDRRFFRGGLVPAAGTNTGNRKNITCSRHRQALCALVQFGSWDRLDRLRPHVRHPSEILRIGGKPLYVVIFSPESWIDHYWQAPISSTE